MRKITTILITVICVAGLTGCIVDPMPDCLAPQVRVDGECEDIVIDETPSLYGVEDVRLYVGNLFEPLVGVGAIGKEDGDITSYITMSGYYDTMTPGSYSLTYSITDSDGTTVTITRVITVVEAPVLYPTGFFDYGYRFNNTEMKLTLLAAAEKYLMNNMYAGVPLFSNGSMNLYSSRLELPVEKYVAVMGFGTRFATMSEDDSNVKMDDNQFGNVGEYTYRTRISDNPQTFNQWFYDTSTDSALMSEYYGSLYDYVFNEDKTGYDVVPAMAATDPVAINPEETSLGKTIARTWRIELKDGLQWTYHSDTDISSLPDGHEVIDANDFVLTYKKALEEGWFRAVSGGGDFIVSAQSIVGAVDYYNLWDDPIDPYSWDDVGIKAIDDLTIEFTFENDQSAWLVKYWLSSFVVSPIHLELFDLLGDDYGTDEKTIAYHGPYVLDYYEEEKILKFIKNQNYAEPTWDFYTHKTFVILHNNAIAFEEFEEGRLESIGLPNDRFDAYKDDPRLKRVPGATTYRIMINGFGSVDAQREHFPDGSWTPEPILANQDFKMAMFFAIDRKYLAEEVLKTRYASMYLFSDAYLVTAEDGVPYRNTPQGLSVGEGLSPTTYGYNKDAATALFKQAVAELIAEGVIVPGIDADNPTVITLEFNYFSGSESQVLMFNYIKEASEETFVDDVNFVEVKLEGFAKDFPAIYYDHMMLGEFDLSIGGISGNTLCPSSFLDLFCSDNRSGFFLNWGIDTSVAEIPVVYNTSNGVRYNEIWSLDAIASALNGEVYLIEGEEAELPSAKDIEYTPTTVTFTVDKFDSSHYQDFTYSLQTYDAASGRYIDVDGYTEIEITSQTVTLTGLEPGYDDYPTKYIGDYRVLINYVYALDTEQDDTSYSDWWMQPSTIKDATEVITDTSLDITIELNEDFDTTVIGAKLLNSNYEDILIPVSVEGLHLSIGGLSSGTIYIIEITYADGTIDYYYATTESSVV
ncbi:ABC transporter substrate-binding protein [Candidatus Izimaplasma bacterium]|nr:ABC transporter substrate-binding protein [Candidatus Izimaplasma bacterium]